MKKYFLLFFLLFIPSQVLPGVTLNWMPILGMNFTWQESISSGSVNRYYPGFAGGTGLEVHFTGHFGIKTGLNLSAPVYTHQQKTADPDNGDFTPVNILHTDNITGLEIPLLARLYIGGRECIEFFAGAGFTNLIRISHTVITEDRDTGESSAETVFGSAWYAAWLLDAGVRIKAGPGMITVGGGFSFGKTPGWLEGDVSMIRAYAGYLF